MGYMCWCVSAYWVIRVHNDAIDGLVSALPCTCRLNFALERKRKKQERHGESWNVNVSRIFLSFFQNNRGAGHGGIVPQNQQKGEKMDP